MEINSKSNQKSDNISSALNTALDYLRSQQKDGFWSYLPGQDWALEPAVWSAIACRQEADCANKFLQRIFAEQNSDGGWSNEPAKLGSDWSTATALFAMQMLKSKNDSEKLGISSPNLLLIDSASDKAAGWLMENRAEYYSSAAKFALLVWKGPEYDYERGWPWTTETFDWVEPTAYALLALRNSGFLGQKKIVRATELAEAFLLKLVMKDGGWNFGDRNPYGTRANPPDVQTTALASLALRHIVDHPKVNKSIGWLAGQASHEQSVNTNAWLALALSMYGKDVAALRERLVQSQNRDGSISNNLLTHAIATLALDERFTYSGKDLPA